ncbi:hypothetical protein [Vibrio owensii]|uniref:hypothetical protein n=1 Tax=Vibrio harveyi group TaxID=717610 RepID=UPI003CC67160
MTNYDILVEPSRSEFEPYTLKDVSFRSPSVSAGDAIELYYDLTDEQKDKDAEGGIVRGSAILTVLKATHKRLGNTELKVTSSLKVK